MVAAQYFDGRTTAAHAVTLTLDGEWLQMRNDYLDRALVVPVLGMADAAFFPAVT
jgi:hypothetical protein